MHARSRESASCLLSLKKPLSSIVAGSCKGMHEVLMAFPTCLYWTEVIAMTYVSFKCDMIAAHNTAEDMKAADRLT